MFWILVAGVCVLGIILVLTIAYLCLYLGYYSPVEAKIEENKYSNHKIAYKGKINGILEKPVFLKILTKLNVYFQKCEERKRIIRNLKVFVYFLGIFKL